MKVPFDNLTELTEQDRSVTIAATMIKYGGGFVAALGRALQCADKDNTRRIKEAFPEYWNRYSEIAEMGGV